MFPGQCRIQHTLNLGDVVKVVDFYSPVYLDPNYACFRPDAPWLCALAIVTEIRQHLNTMGRYGFSFYLLMPDFSLDPMGEFDWAMPYFPRENRFYWEFTGLNVLLAR